MMKMREEKWLFATECHLYFALINIIMQSILHVHVGVYTCNNLKTDPADR